VTRSFAILIVSAAVALLAAGIWLIGARKAKVATGYSIPNYSALKPDKLTMTECRLELAGSEYKADLKKTVFGDEIQVDILAFGEVIESERYKSTDLEFSVVNAGGEVYVPPIPLVKYGMHVGDSWTWIGDTRTGPAPHPAKATITTTTEDMAIGGSTIHDVIRIDVVLSIDSGKPGAPSLRKLKFWIAPDKGVVQREFGDYSKRGPAGE